MQPGNASQSPVYRCQSLKTSNVRSDGLVGPDGQALRNLVGAVSALPGSPAGLTAVGGQFWSEDSAGILATAENSDNFGKFRG